MRDDAKAKLVEGILQNRHLRRRHLPPELFSEPGWEALLMLFLADAESRRMTGHDLAEESGTAPLVMSRWVQHLSASGVILGDGKGDLSDALTLSPACLSSVEAYLDETQAAMRGYMAEAEEADDGRSRPTSA